MAVWGIFRNRGPDVVLEEPDRKQPGEIFKEQGNGLSNFNLTGDKH